MAICWIEKVINNHPTASLHMNCQDHGRHPRIKNTATQFGYNDWFAVGPKQTVEFENFAVPWHGSLFGSQVLLVKSDSPERRDDGIGYYINNEHAWDWLFILGRDQVLGRVEVGSMGDASLINHSSWHLILTETGEITLSRQWRQGLPRDSFKPIITFVELAPQYFTVVIVGGIKHILGIR